MITGILFDKDGTLYDFERSWSGFAGAMLLDLASDNGSASTPKTRALPPTAASSRAPMTTSAPRCCPAFPA